jgi:exosortase family protein XrtF
VLNKSFLKSLFIKYKSVVRFVLLFLGTYLLLLFLYSLYLSASKGGNYQPDFITNLVANQSKAIISSFGYLAEVVPHSSKTSMQLVINNQYLAEIIEGCNGISVIILFISFIIAFAKKFKKTFFYLLAGCVLIYGVNLIRIAILAIALYKYPQYQEFLHGIVFPSIIYGMVFLLWVYWVRNITKSTIEE